VQKVCAYEYYIRFHDTAWSVGGVVVYIIFLIVVAFCLGGCVWNAVREGKQGWDVVPCINLARDLGSKVGGGGGVRRGPQEDYSSVGGDKGAYGSTYQTDL